MAKADKDFELRMSGMLAAYNIAKEKGIEAIEENGVVVVLYDGGMKEFERAFSKTRRLAKVHGYVNSYGARAKKQMNDGGEKHE